MFRFLRRQSGGTIATLYGAIVAQARADSFYRDYGVPDTVEGRFDMIVLHVALLFRRIRSGSTALGRTGQDLFDLFCQDMDANFREMGVSDLGVPRVMRRVGEAYYGRAAVYEDALAGSDEGLAEALSRNVFAGEGGDPVRMARYVRATVEDLARQDDAALARGQVRFPNPATISGELKKERGS